MKRHKHRYGSISFVVDNLFGALMFSYYLLLGCRSLHFVLVTVREVPALRQVRFVRTVCTRSSTPTSGRASGNNDGDRKCSSLTRLSPAYSLVTRDRIFKQNLWFRYDTNVQLLRPARTSSRLPVVFVRLRLATEQVRTVNVIASPQSLPSNHP